MVPALPCPALGVLLPSKPSSCGPATVGGQGLCHTYPTSQGQAQGGGGLVQFLARGHGWQWVLVASCAHLRNCQAGLREGPA